MDTHSKTAEQLKGFIDRVDTKAQEMHLEVTDFVQETIDKYREEIQEIKAKAEHTKEEWKEGSEERLHLLKESYDKLLIEGRSFSNRHFKPLKAKIKALKEQGIKSGYQTVEKFDHVKEEIEELFETTKLALHNFKETYKK